MNTESQIFPKAWLMSFQAVCSYWPGRQSLYA